MASVYETEQDSDEDCQVYFLKPVNEYNIFDKIKEANKELFANDSENSDELDASQMNRKVSFAANLEEYEPQTGISLKNLQDKLSQDFTETYEEIVMTSKVEEKLEIITEEEDATNEDEMKNSMETISQDTEIINKQQSPADINNIEIIDELIKDIAPEPDYYEKAESSDENEIIEEICEEIQVMDMENDKCEAPKETKSDSPGTIQRKILKQITFDCTEEDESDNKSLTNLLISDNEIRSDEDELDYNGNEPDDDNDDNEDNKNSSINKEYYDYEKDEDDDKLPIIVASYLRNDMVCDKTSLTGSSIKCSPRTTKSRKLAFNKRFSFRRKAKSSNAIASSSNNHSSNKRRFMPPPEVTDLKLHYKTCCEYKNSQQKLPKYTGYISEYGLSREQLIERAHKLQQKQRGKIIETFKNSEADTRKMHDNEKAFTTWLKNKIRFPINKTRNMFDVKRPFGLKKFTSVGGNALPNDDSKQILNTTKYRSISAKFTKS